MADAEPSFPSYTVTCSAVCSTSAIAAEASLPPSVCAACGIPTASVASPPTRRQSTPPPRPTPSSSLPSPPPSLPMTSKPPPSASPPPTTSTTSTPPLLATTSLDSSPPYPTLSVVARSPTPLTPSRHGCACPRPELGAPYFFINTVGNITVRPHGIATLLHQEIDLMKGVRKAIDPKPTSEPLEASHP